MAVYRTKFERFNFGFDPSLCQSADVVFEMDEKYDEEVNHGAFCRAAGKACGIQNPHWFEDYSSPIEGYSGWSSVMGGHEFTEVLDIDLDFDLGTPGEGLPRIAETFTDNREDDKEFTFSWQRHSWRVSGFYKTYTPPPVDENDVGLVFTMQLLAEIQEEELAEMTPAQRIRAEQKMRIIRCTREEAEFVSGSGVSGTIRRLEDITITGRVEWEDRTIAQARRDYKINEDNNYPTTIWMYWLAE